MIAWMLFEIEIRIESDALQYCEKDLRSEAVVRSAIHPPDHTRFRSLRESKPECVRPGPRCAFDEDVDAVVQARGDVSADPSDVSRRIESARGSRAHLQRGHRGCTRGCALVSARPERRTGRLGGHSRQSKRGDAKPSGADAQLQGAYVRLQVRDGHLRATRRAQPQVL
jgi:hypothetical protein